MGEWDKFLQREIKKTERLKTVKPCGDCKRKKVCHRICDDYMTWYSFQWDKARTKISTHIRKSVLHRDAEQKRNDK